MTQIGSALGKGLGATCSVPLPNVDIWHCCWHKRDLHTQSKGQSENRPRLRRAFIQTRLLKEDTSAVIMTGSLLVLCLINVLGSENTSYTVTP